MSEVLGFDIGGSAIKTAPVDTGTGTLLTECEIIRHGSRIDPQAIAAVIKSHIEKLSWSGAIGVGFPGVVIEGNTFTAAHLGDEWLKFDFLSLLKTMTAAPIALLNDADAAGLAEMRFGAAQEMNNPDSGTVLLLTFGSGIGSALFRGGRLLPNTEFGHIEMNGGEAEAAASARVRKRLNLDWETWGGRVNEYLNLMDKLLSPERIIIGGGVSENYDSFKEYLKTRAQIVPARFGNEAGLIGAALAIS